MIREKEATMGKGNEKDCSPGWCGSAVWSIIQNVTCLIPGWGT